MKILILEDEPVAQRELSRMVSKLLPEATINCLDSIAEATSFLNNIHVDLIFSDIQLTDGQSFELFKKVPTDAPVIFTTAYDSYALQAFKHNGLDYLLKPYDEEALTGAVIKFRKQFQVNLHQEPVLEEQIQAEPPSDVKERFLVTIGDQLKTINTEDIAYFYAEGNTVYIVPHKGTQVIINYSLEELKGMLNRKDFFRINRKYIVSFDAIMKIHKYFNSRLALELAPKINNEGIIVSREKCKAFTNWLKS